MASFVEGSYRSFKAGADLSDKAFYVVKTNTNGEVVLAGAATDAIEGVIETPVKQGDTASVAVVSGDGSFKVKISGAVAKGAYLAAGTGGKAVAATQSTAGAQPSVRVFGRALAAGADGDVIEYTKCNFLY